MNSDEVQTEEEFTEKQQVWHERRSPGECESPEWNVVVPEGL